MKVLLDADVVIHLFKTGAGSLLGDVSQVHSLAMTVEVYEEIERGNNNWIPNFKKTWGQLAERGDAELLEMLVGEATFAFFQRLISHYSPTVKDITLAFDDRGDFANIAWLLSLPDLVYVTEDHGAKYRGFLEVPAIPSQLATPWALMRSTYQVLSISETSLVSLKKWDKNKGGSPKRPIWWPAWLDSLGPSGGP
jgi:hypothetical protein